MTGDTELEKDVRYLGPGADVMHNQMPLGVSRTPIHDDTDVRQITGQHPGYRVAGLGVTRITSHGQCCFLTLKERLEIRHPTVVDIGVGLRMPPEPWIGRERSYRVFVYRLL